MKCPKCKNEMVEKQVFIAQKMGTYAIAGMQLKLCGTMKKVFKCEACHERES